MSSRGADFYANYQDYGVDFRNQRVFLHHALELDEGTDYVVRNLLWLDSLQTHAGPIEFWINTPGGWFEEMWAIYDVIRTCRRPIVTIAYGNVSSAGCLLLACGTAQRYSHPHASMMWHGGTTGAEGSLGPWEVEDRVAFEKFDRGRWFDAMAEHTKPPGTRSKKQRAGFWEEWARGREKWLDAKGMVKHGIVDEIWERPE